MSPPQTLPVVLGTAGHIDHGKSALVEALCGDHPDRWAEEKERGITMDLGYAEAVWEDGLEIGFVDVPGHERLVRKMVAGATGMGAALLVVACDDGVMPQTREHFEVLQLLGIHKGLVALTKADLADEDMLELVQAEVQELLADSAWEGCPLLSVSAHSGQGMTELREALRRLAEEVQRQPSPAAFRLPVQRAFALHGAGTVATGVCAFGLLQEGDSVEVQPGGKESRVRRVHIHGRPHAETGPGLRTALNLPDFEKLDCPRGTVLAAPGTIQSGKLLRIWWQPLPTAPQLKQGGEVQVLSGTAAERGRLYLPPKHSQEGVVAEVLLDAPMALVPGDGILLRRLSPAGNLGSGPFLGFAHQRLRAKDVELRQALETRAKHIGNPVELLAHELDQSQTPLKLRMLSLSLGWEASALVVLLEQLLQEGRVRKVGDGYVGLGGAGALVQDVAEVVAHWQKKHPHRSCLPVQALRTRLGKEKFSTLLSMSVDEMELLGLEPQAGTLWRILNASLPEDLVAQGCRCLAHLLDAGLMPPDVETLCAEQNVSVAWRGVIAEYLEDTGQVLRRGPLLFAREPVEKLREMVVAQLNEGGVKIPELRDSFGTSRKYLMPLLEFLDERGVTMRRGPNRILKNPTASLV